MLDYVFLTLKKIRIVGDFHRLYSIRSLPLCHEISAEIAPLTCSTNPCFYLSSNPCWKCGARNTVGNGLPRLAEMLRILYSSNRS